MIFGIEEELFIEIVKNTAITLLILIITYLVTVISGKIIRFLIKKSSRKKAASEATKKEPDSYSFISHLSMGLIFSIGCIIAIYTLPPLRNLAVSLIAGAGVLAIAIGLASQQAFSNLVSGIMIAIFKPIKIGDRIKIREGVSGIIEDITLRHTVIRNFENKRLIIPNSKISEETIENSNYGDEKVCRFVEIGISYDSDINRAIKIMREEAENHPKNIDNRTQEEKNNKVPKVVVRVVGFGESSVNLKAWAWAKNPADAFALGCDLNKSIKERFDREGVEIPYPYRTLVYKKGLPKPKKDKTQKKKVKKKKVKKKN